MISNAEYFSQLRDLEDQYAAEEITRPELIAAQVALANQWAVPATLAAQVVDFTAEQRTVLDQIGLLNLTGTVASVGDLPGGAANGDTYVVEGNGHSYIRLTGVWKDLGPYGGRGGVAIFSVEGEPSSDLGVAGDLALDLDTGDFYGPKTAGGWGEPVLATGLQAKVDAAEAAKNTAIDLVAPFEALAEAVGDRDNSEAEVAHEFADEAGAIVGDLTKAGHFRGRGLTIRDDAEADVAITAEGGTLVLPATKLGGLVVDEIDDPGFSLVVTTTDGGVIFEVPNDPEAVNNTTELLRRANASKPYVLSRRRPTFAFIFDDLNDSDQAVYDIFEEFGLPVGFALQTNHINVDNIGLYQTAYLRGGSVLAHSVDHAVMNESTTLTQAEVEAQMQASKAAIEAHGIRVSGWVTPSSVLKAAYFSSMVKFFGYGFTKLNAGVFNATVDPLKMDRVGLEALLTDATVSAVYTRIDTAIAGGELVVFYGHELPSTYLHSAPPPDNVPVLREVELRAILTYLKAKAAAGDCLILSPDEAVAQYYKTPYA